jgi:hypothetical protein
MRVTRRSPAEAVSAAGAASFICLIPSKTIARCELGGTVDVVPPFNQVSLD